jgi:hypothetical protein
MKTLWQNLAHFQSAVIVISNNSRRKEGYSGAQTKTNIVFYQIDKKWNALELNP